MVEVNCFKLPFPFHIIPVEWLLAVLITADSVYVC